MPVHLSTSGSIAGGQSRDVPVGNLVTNENSDVAVSLYEQGLTTTEMETRRLRLKRHLQFFVDGFFGHFCPPAGPLV
jgi:hypothetical protein